MSIHPTDQSLVKAVLAGGSPGRDAFQVLVLRHQGWMVRYLTYLLGDVATAHDVAQDTFVRAHMKMHQLKGGQLAAWLRRIATRLAFNVSRNEKTRMRYEDAAAALRPTGVHERDALESREILLKVLGVLPYPYREILVQRYVEELTIVEIASTLEIGESAVKMRLKRAREAFYDEHERVMDV